MTAEQSFERYEKKYLLTQKQLDQIYPVLKNRLSMDHYGKHTICNIYFDTDDYKLIRESLEKPPYKEKLRLRCYGTPSSEKDTVFVEIKKKYDGIVYKRRISMTMGQAHKYLYYGIHPGFNCQVMKELEYFHSLYCLKPVVCLSYDRTAYFGNTDQQLRVTIDKGIRGRQYDMDLTRGSYGTLIMKQDLALIEVKMPGAMPVWMSRLFSEEGIFPITYSKYGAYYKQFILCQTIQKGGQTSA